MQVIKGLTLSSVFRFSYGYTGGLFIAFIISFIPIKYSEAQGIPEYQVKAAFLYNFTQFIEWPPDAFASADAPLVIGILGEDPFGEFLDETVRGETVNGHPLVVQRYRDKSEIVTCHILFISDSKSDQLRPLLEDLRSKSILTVGDASNFTAQGGMIQFFTQSNKTRIRINHQKAKEAALTINAKLLRLADIVSYPN